MNVTHIKNFDIIKNLPIDEGIKLSNNEMEILNLVFNENVDENVSQTSFEKQQTLAQEIQDPLIGAILFLLLSLPLIDNFLLDFIQNKWLLVIKTTIFLILFWFFTKLKKYSGMMK